MGGIDRTATGAQLKFLRRFVDSVHGLSLILKLREARPEETAPADTGFVREAS